MVSIQCFVNLVRLLRQKRFSNSDIHMKVTPWKSMKEALIDPMEKEVWRSGFELGSRKTKVLRADCV